MNTRISLKTGLRRVQIIQLARWVPTFIGICYIPLIRKFFKFNVYTISLEVSIKIRKNFIYKENDDEFFLISWTLSLELKLIMKFECNMALDICINTFSKFSVEPAIHVWYRLGKRSGKRTHSFRGFVNFKLIILKIIVH